MNKMSKKDWMFLSFVLIFLNIALVGVSLFCIGTDSDAVLAHGDKVSIENKMLKISNCKILGHLAAVVGEEVVAGIPFADVIDDGETDGSLYVKTKAYGSIMLQMNGKDGIIDFQNDIIVDCLTDKMKQR